MSFQTVKAAAQLGGTHLGRAHVLLGRPQQRHNADPAKVHCGERDQDVLNGVIARGKLQACQCCRAVDMAQACMLTTSMPFTSKRMLTLRLQAMSRMHDGGVLDRMSNYLAL